LRSNSATANEDAQTVVHTAGRRLGKLTPIEFKTLYQPTPKQPDPMREHDQPNQVQARLDPRDRPPVRPVANREAA
jgi:hypothetical protein